MEMNIIRVASKLFSSLCASPVMIFHSFLELLLPLWWFPRSSRKLWETMAFFRTSNFAVWGCDDQ